MTNKDLIAQYVDTGVGIPEYQFKKLPTWAKKTYLRKIEISLGDNIYNFEYYYGELPEDIQIKVINLDAFNIKLLKNPSESAQLLAIKKDLTTLEYIIKPTETVQLAAVNKRPDAIYYIEKPTRLVKQLQRELYGR
jgi:hypothetical protein